jgi:hypothetical protein
MKLPEKIKGRNRIRDAAIVIAFKREKMGYSQIAEKFKLTERRILQILAVNHAFIKRDKEWEKEKRIARLERWLDDPKNKDTRKDPVEVQAELRSEIEGDDKSSGGRGETKIIIIRSGDEAPAAKGDNGRADNQAQFVSRSLSI